MAKEKLLFVDLWAVFSDGELNAQFILSFLFFFAVRSPGQRGTYDGSDGRMEHRPDDRYHDRELWFKAAVIAVPIAGGFILVLLVLLAVRMLRNDSRRHTQLMQMRRHRDIIAKAQLYVADHFCDKNDHHLCFNSLEKPHRTNVNSVNVKVDMAGSGYEKLNSSFSETGGKCHSNPTHASTVAPHGVASDNSTRSSATLHTSATQTPVFTDSLGDLTKEKSQQDSNRKNTAPCDSVIVWGNNHQKKKKEDHLGDVV